MNVKYKCDKCHHTAFAPPDTEPACRENLGDDCEMEQVEEFDPASHPAAKSDPKPDPKPTPVKKAPSGKPSK